VKKLLDIFIRFESKRIKISSKLLTWSTNVMDGHRVTAYTALMHTYHAVKIVNKSDVLIMNIN